MRSRCQRRENREVDESGESEGVRSGKGGERR